TGRRVKSFGKRGYASIDLQTLGAKTYLAKLTALPKHEVQLIAESPTRQYVLRFTKSGKLDPTWGRSGVVTLDLPANYAGVFFDSAEGSSITAEGGLLIPANHAPGKASAEKLGVLKLTAAGNVATSWADDGFWTPPAPKAGNPYSVTGQTLLTAVRKGGGYAMLYADGTPGALDVGLTSTLKLAYVDKSSGVTTLFNDKAGSYYNGGDTGFPDTDLWTLGRSSSGMIFGRAQGHYESPGGTYQGRAIRFSADADQPVADQAISNSGFAAGALAIDPEAKYLYLCGSYGVTSSKAKDKARREQRKAVAIKRIAL
ncbi:MAG: hypothetical protein QM648_11680, partial [Solirubrobacterales bacterium]